MDKRFHIRPYTFRGRLLLFLLLAAVAACVISAAGSFMMGIGAIGNEMKSNEHELAVYLLSLEQKTELSPADMLVMTTNEELVGNIVEHPEWHLSAEDISRLRSGELITQTSGFTVMPITYLKLRDEIISIHPSRDFNTFLSVLPRVGFTILLSLILFAILSILISFLISRPVTQLTQATRQITEGDFSIRLPEEKPGEMGELMRSFNKMTEELSRNVYLQKDFISSVSHEFRTPIASIKGFTRLLQMSGLDETSRQEYITMIAQEGDRLSRLSETLLRLSALEQQMTPASLSTFQLDEQIRQVILQLEPSWSAKQIEWQLNLEPVTIESDAELLMQVWTNLLQNAIKFSHDGGEIEVSVTKLDHAEITVADHGIGMTQETQERIFDRFYQGDTSRSKEGVGLGLCLVKRIVDILHGEIRVRSVLHEGSTFRIRLPYQLNAAKGAQHDAR